MTNQLVYFELHVDDQTFYIHGVIKAKSKNDADKKLRDIHGEHYHLQLKGLLGKATEKKMISFLKDSIPKDALVNK